MTATIEEVPVRDPDTGEPIRCGCGSSDVVCFDAGQAALYVEPGHILIRRAVPATGRCLRCWLPPVGTQLGLF